MKILHSEIYEREGNDSWLIDKIQIIQEDGELILRHKINYQGWSEPVKSTNEINLDEFDSIEEKQERVNKYMENECLSEDMEVPNLKQILNSEDED